MKCYMNMTYQALTCTLYEIYVYLCIYISIFVYLYACLYIHMYTCGYMYMYMYICIYVYMYICLYVYVHIHIICICICICMCICICIYTYVYLYVYEITWLSKCNHTYVSSINYANTISISCSSSLHRCHSTCKQTVRYDWNLFMSDLWQSGVCFESHFQWTQWKT